MASGSGGEFSFVTVFYVFGGDGFSFFVNLFELQTSVSWYHLLYVGDLSDTLRIA